MNMKNDRVIAVIYFIAGAMCVLAALNYFRHTNRRIALGALMLCAAAAVIIAGVVWIKKNAAAIAASKIRTGGWNGGIEADGNEKYLFIFIQLYRVVVAAHRDLSLGHAGFSSCGHRLQSVGSVE